MNTAALPQIQIPKLKDGIREMAKEDTISIPKWAWALLVTATLGFGGWMTHVSVQLSDVPQALKLASANAEKIQLIREEQLKRTNNVYDVPTMNNSLIRMEVRLGVLEKELAEMKSQIEALAK